MATVWTKGLMGQNLITLAGRIQASGGDAFVGGESIVSSGSRATARLGFCPQVHIRARIQDLRFNIENAI